VPKSLPDQHSNRKAVGSIDCIKHNLAFHSCFQSLSTYCSCAIAAYRMIFSFNLSVYLYQLVVTYVICWLPVDKQYHDEVCIMYNQLKGVETSRFFSTK
jgi:hypothetical protein